jgi:hypothetical protein
MKTATRYRVLDINDKLCGVWYAVSEVAAIAAAIREGYDAWSASSAHSGGF